MSSSSKHRGRMGLSERYIRWLLRHRKKSLLAIAVVTAVAAISVRNVWMNFSAADFYDYPGNPAVPLLERYYKEFGDPGGYLAVVVEADDIFSDRVLLYVQRVTRKLRPNKTLSSVKSLTTANIAYHDPSGVVVGQLMPTLPKTTAQREKLRRVSLSSQLIVRRLVSPDSKATVVVASIAAPGASKSVALQRKALESVKKALASLEPPPGVRVRISGSPVVEIEATDLLVSDQMIFVPIAYLLILIVYLLIFRSWHAILLPLAASLEIVWTMGLFPAFGRPIDMVLSTIPLIIIVYGSVDPIFFLTRFRGKLAAGRPRDEAIVETFKELLLPCFLTSFSTVLAFASYAFLELPTISIFGVVTAIGVAFAFIAAVTILPLVLASLKAPKLHGGAGRLSGWLDDRMRGLWRLLRNRMGYVLAAMLAVMGICSVIGAQQKVSVMYAGLLPPGQSLDGIRLLERKLGGVTRTSVLIEGAPDSMKRSAVLRAIAAVDQSAERHRIVTSSLSLADLLMELNQAFVGGKDARKLPKSPELAAQYLVMLDPADRGDFVNDDYSKTHISIFTEDRGSLHWRRLNADLEKAIATNFKDLDVKVSVTGFARTLFPVLDDLVIEMLLGFLISFLVIVAVVWAIFRSWRIALVSILPNLLPVIGCFFVLSTLEITLRLGTAIVFSVCTGILFDDSIHFAAWLVQEHRERGGNPDEIVEGGLRSVGPPAIFTSVILSCGFSIFILSSFPDLKVFGVLAVTVLACGCLADITLMPILMRKFYRWNPRTRELSTPSGAIDGKIGESLSATEEQP